jgi:hypothetical protein
MDLGFALTACYYGLYVLGAGSVGYLLVRLSYPDVRLLDKDAKLGVSAVLGFFIMCVGLALEWAAGRASDFGFGLQSYQGLMPLLSFLLVLLTFGIMKVYFFVNSPRMLTVGLPIHSASKAAEAAMEKPELGAQKKPWQAPAAASAAQAAGQAKPEPLPARPVVTVTKQPSGLFGFLDLLFKKQVPQVAQRKQELVEIDIPIIQRVEGARPGPAAQGAQAAPVRLESVDLSAQEPQAAGAGRKAAARVRADANVPAPFVEGLQEKELSKAKSAAGRKAPKSLESAFASKAAPFVSGIAPDIRQAETPAGRPQAGERGRSDYYDRKINELLAGFPAEDAERKAEAPQKPKPEPPKTRKELEVESELMVEDLVPKASREAAAGQQPEQPGQRRRFYEQAAAEGAAVPQAAESPESRRRMYARQGSIRVIAPRDVSETDEFADIISDIYSQLKSSAREESLNDSIKVNVPPSSAGLSKAQPKEGAAKGRFDELEAELFGQQAKPAALPAQEESVFGQLSKISAVEGAGAAKAAETGLKPSSDMEFVHIGNEAGMGCPTCHQKNSRIVFCPYCGSGMCTNCSPNVRVDAGGFAYSCPKCGEEVHIRKKAAAPAASF